MNFHILPNWAKKLGLSLFIIASLINGGFNFFNGTRTIQTIDADSLNKFNEGANGFRGLLNAFTGGGLILSIDLFAIIGMIIYMLSKEKTEDDYINKLRLESFQLTTLAGLLIVIPLYLFSKDLKLTLDYIIYPFLWFYIGLFYLKKRFVL